MSPLEKVADGFNRIRWPQAFLLAAFCASIVCTLIFTPPEVIDRIAALNWKAIVSATIAVLTALAGIWGGSVMKPKDMPSTSTFSELPPPLVSMPPPKPPRMPTEDRTTPREIPPKKQGSTLVAVLIIVSAIAFIVIAFAVMHLMGCGGAAQQHSALDRLAEVADPSYALAVDACDEAEVRVIERTGTTYEEDQEAFTQIRATCDRVFGAFEALRLAHRAARASVNEGAPGAVQSAMSSLTEAWRALQMLLPEVAALREGES